MENYNEKHFQTTATRKSFFYDSINLNTNTPLEANMRGQQLAIDLFRGWGLHHSRSHLASDVT